MVNGEDPMASGQVGRASAGDSEGRARDLARTDANL